MGIRKLQGRRSPNVPLFPPPVVSNRDPMSTDSNYPVGQTWINPSAGTSYVLTAVSGSATWAQSSSGSAPPGITWEDNATTQTMSTNTGYIVKGGAQVLTLPISSNVGDVIEVVNAGATSWQIQAGGGQTIFVNNGMTAPGGTVTTTGSRDTIRMLSVVADVQWQALSTIGNLTVV